MFYARYLKENNRNEEARPLAERALSLNPQSFMNLTVLMEIYNNLSLWTELQQTAEQTLTLLPNDPVAIEFLTAAKRKKPLVNPSVKPNTKSKNSPEDLLNLSLAFYKAGMYEKCIQACRQAIELKPDYADAYSNIAAAYNQLKRWEDGAAAAKKALEIEPDHALAKGNLKWALTKSYQ